MSNWTKIKHCPYDGTKCLILEKTTEEVGRLEAIKDVMDSIAEDALWHDGYHSPDALEDIRTSVKSLGYTQAKCCFDK